MDCKEIVEFICAIISTLSIIASLVMICHRCLSKISVCAVTENNFLKLYAVALHRKMVVYDLNINVKRKTINKNDNFFYGGGEKIELDVDSFKLIKMIPLDSQLKGLIFIKFETECENEIIKIVRIRRK